MEKKEVAAELWERSAALDEELRYVAYRYLEHVNRALVNNALYKKQTNWGKWVLYELPGPKLSWVFELLPDTVVAALGILKPAPTANDVVELYEWGAVVESRPLPEKAVSLLMKGKNAVFVGSIFLFRNSGHINITVLRERRSISMTLLQSNKPQCLLKSPTRLSLLTAPEKQENALQLTDAAWLMYLSEDASKGWRC